MKLSTKGRYALIGLMELAINDGKRPVPLIEIAKSLGISLSYIEQLFSMLRGKGLVKGARGPGGGYRLTDNAWGTSMAEIFAMFDKSAERRDEQAAEIRASYEPYLMWQILSKDIYHYLEGITLEQFVKANAPAAQPEPVQQQDVPQMTAA
ncbi:MAG: Fe-S cluster assembly transcriptional regulator IscR [Gammaproteobacteria bacterium]|nr:MAG: Fe-S cluster assembly transcriptional regulator IscR [Gammaproteobacteria bacterium]